jgi:DNA topoisomerase I
MRIRRSDPAGPGYRRRRAGAGFTYVDPDGKRVIDRELRDRFAGLVIPPAWVQVWICPYANGHIQAIGTDAAGRRQYPYHSQWRTQRDAVKHQRALAMGRALPRATRVVGEHLQDRRPTRRRVLAAAFRVLDARRQWLARWPRWRGISATPRLWHALPTSTAG